MNTPAKRPRRGAEKNSDPLAPPPLQRELAAAPVAPAANDEARAGLAVISTQLAVFDAVEAGVAELERRYRDVAYSVETKKGMDEAVEARRAIKAPRVELEHARTSAKAPLLKLGRDIDGRAQAITARLVAIEKPIDDQIKAQERKEAERKADLERRLAEIRGTPQKCIGKSTTDLQVVLEALESLPLGDFAEYREQAAKAQFDATQAVQVLLQQARQAEELAALREKERKEEARKAAIQQAIDAIGAPLQQLPMCRTAARVHGLIDNVGAVQIAEAVYQEFAPAAREKKAAVLAALVQARDEKQAAEDARAAAAAAPAPTSAPTPAPAPAPAPAAASGATAFTDGTFGRLQKDFDRVFQAPNTTQRAAAALASQGAPSDADPFTAPRPAAAAGTELSMSVPQRPTDSEMLAVLADHYDTDPATVAGWLRTFDVAAALAQLALPIA